MSFLNFFLYSESCKGCNCGGKFIRSKTCNLSLLVLLQVLDRWSWKTLQGMDFLKFCMGERCSSVPIKCIQIYGWEGFFARKEFQFLASNKLTNLYVCSRESDMEKLVQQGNGRETSITYIRLHLVYILPVCRCMLKVKLAVERENKIFFILSFWL